MKLGSARCEKSRHLKHAAAVGVCAPALALWLARTSIAEWLIARTLDGMGLGPSRVEISVLGVSHARLRLAGSAVGSVARLDAEYGWSHGRGAPIERLRIEGARLHLTWKDGKLLPAIAPTQGGAGAPVGRIEIVDSSVTLDTVAGAIIADLSGTVSSGEDAAVDLALAIRAPAGHLTGAVTGRLAPDGAVTGAFKVTGGEAALGAVVAERLTGEVRVAARAERIELLNAALAFEQIGLDARRLGPARLTASLEPPQSVLAVALESAPLRFALRADGTRAGSGVPFSAAGVASASFLGALAGSFAAEAGEIRINVTGTTPPLASLRAALSLQPEAWIRLAKADGELNATAAGIATPGRGAAAHAAASLRLHLVDGSLIGTTSDGVSVSGIELARAPSAGDILPTRISTLSVAPAGAAPLLSIAMKDRAGLAQAAGTLVLEAPQLTLRAPFAATATFDPAQWTAAVAPISASGQFGLHGELALELPPDHSLPAGLAVEGRYALDPSMLRLTTDTATLSLRDARWGDTLSLPGVSRAALRPGATLSRDRRAGTIHGAAALQPFVWNVAIGRRGAAPAKLVVAAERLGFTLDPGRRGAALDEARVAFPDQALTADGMSGTFAAAPDATSLRLAIADLHSTAEPALFAPLRAGLELRIADDDARFSATLRDAAGRLSVTAKGDHRLDSGQGGAVIAMKPVELGGEGTLKALSPAVAARVVSATGTISGGGTVHWGGRTGPGALSLMLEDVALAGTSFKVSDLNGGVRLDSLVPLHSGPGQHLGGSLEFPAIGRVPIELAFRLEPGKLVIEHGRAALFDGAFETTDAVIDVATGVSEADLRILDVNLESMFTVLNLEQLKGSGRIGGVLPLRFQRQRVAVDRGRLEASTPGTVQIGVTALADQLKSYGENVDLAFRALTDFHYQRLTIDADKPLLGSGKAVFHLEGSNPAVMAGQPFIFNISLETDFDYLAKVLMELSGATSTALGWGVRDIVAP